MQLINTFYVKPSQGESDKIVYVVKDETGKKGLKTIDEPDITFYANKEWEDIPVLGKPIDEVNKITVPYRYMYKEIAEMLGDESMAFYKSCVNERRFNLLYKLGLNPNIHGSDIDINDYYIGKFLDKYPVDKAELTLTKSFMDIEVDISEYNGFPDENIAPAPVNIITLVLQLPEVSIHTAILKDDRIPMSQDLDLLLADDFQGYIKKSLKEKFGKDYPDVNFKLYSSEAELISSIFELINIHKPDMNGIWNRPFDIKTMINRLNKLGKDAVKVICSPEIPWTKLYYQDDTRNQAYSDKNEHFHCTSFTNYEDMLINYAKLRKAAGKKDSYRLEDIAQEELGVGKEEIPEDDIRTFHLKDFKNFVLYNIVDSVILMELENKTKDMDQLYNVAMITRTRLHKALTKTVSIKNLATKFFLDNGFVISNNHNVDNVEGISFRGAHVANPLKNAKWGMMIGGERSRFLFENVIDMDLSSLYPSIIRAFDMAPQTQFGKLILEIMDPITGEVDDIAPLIADGVIANDWVAFGKKFCNLPDNEELIEIISKDLKAS